MIKPSQLHPLSSQSLLILPLLIAFSLGDDNSLISTIKNSSFNAKDFRRTGVEYKVPLPANLTGVEASAIRVRSRTFSAKGANLTSFQFPSGILSKPFRRRLLLISYNLSRSLSASLYGSRVAAGYSLASPVVGLLACDGWDVTRAGDSELGLKATGELIIIEFPAGDNRTVRYCARFGEGGGFSLEGEEVHGRCSTKGPGSFGVVVRGLAAADRKGKRWRMWAAGVGVVGSLVLVCGVGIWVGSLVKRRRVREMRKEADEGQVLEFMWIGGRKMPFAGLTRTVPVL